MKLNILNPKQALNKAYLKEKVSRDNIELFKGNLSTLLGKIDGYTYVAPVVAILSVWLSRKLLFAGLKTYSSASS